MGLSTMHGVGDEIPLEGVQKPYLKTLWKVGSSDERPGVWGS